MKLCLVFAPYVLALLSIFSCSETRAQTKPSVESTSVQQLARLIERNLKRDQFDRQTSIRLGFRLTKAGEVYSITCLSPTHNANALRASVRALLAGMPFSNTPDLNCPERVLECRIESTSTVTLQNRKVEMAGKPNAASSVGVLLLLLDSCGHMVNL